MKNIFQNIFLRKLPKKQVVWCLGLPYTKETFISCCREEVQSDFIASLEVKYNSNDAEYLWMRYEETAKYIQETIQFLRDRNVDVIEMNTVEQLKNAFSYSTIILTAHRHRFLECLEFSSNMISIENIVDTIPNDYKGIIDISSCYSSTFQMECKKKAIYASYIAAETESSIDLRLFIYKQTVQHLVSHKKNNYLDSFHVIIKRIVEKSKERRRKRDPILLGGNVPSSFIRGGSASAFASNEVKRGESMMIQIYIYKNDEHRRITREANRCDEGSLERSRISLNFDVKEGDEVIVSLKVMNLTKLAQTKSFIWRNGISKICFVVNVPNNFKKEKVFFEALISVNKAILGELSFSVSIVEQFSRDITMAIVESKAFHKIFISYSHKDEQRVKYIAEAYRAQGVDYFFDRHYLKGGDVYPVKIREYINSADLFILCWSKNAAESDYVTLERRQALALAYPQVDMEKASITIHPISIEPRAGYPTDMKQWYNFVEV